MNIRIATGTDSFRIEAERIHTSASSATMQPMKPGPASTFCQSPLAAVNQATRPDSNSPAHIQP